MGSTSQLDLELPPVPPSLMSGLRHANFDFASFAIYNIADNVTDARLAEIANIPQEQWEEAGMENQCVKPATPTANLAGKSLKDVIAAHITTAHQDITYAEDEEGDVDDAGWRPYVFLVVTNHKIEDHGLLMVYIQNAFADPADDNAEEEEDEEKPFFCQIFLQTREDVQPPCGDRPAGRANRGVAGGLRYG
ncbi:hypothetical protein PG995_006132 [Apiospora arundinis]